MNISKIGTIHPLWNRCELMLEHSVGNAKNYWLESAIRFYQGDKRVRYKSLGAGSKADAARAIEYILSFGFVNKGKRFNREIETIIFERAGITEEAGVIFPSKIEDMGEQDWNGLLGGRVKQVSEMANIGKVLEDKLGRIGIHSQDDLARMGSVEAVLRIGERDLSACYNMLYALEGAIRGIRWHAIPKEERALLKESFDEAMRERQA